jgi:ligand-binding sensor domain-containing protein
MDCRAVARVSACFGVLMLGLCSPGLADNGAVAIAVPLQGITIDGDLSDWPSGLTRYPIAELTLAEATDTIVVADLQAYFLIGYSAADNALYLAVDVEDDSVVVDTSSAAVWGTADMCRIIIDPPDTGFGVFFLFGGRHTGVAGQGSPGDLQVAVQQDRHRRRYECRIVLNRAVNAVPLGSGQSLKFDLTLADVDGTGMPLQVSWGPGSNKQERDHGLGDLLLVAAGEVTGRLAGSVDWAAGAGSIFDAVISLRSMEYPDLMCTALTDRTGHFAVDLPAGGYHAELQWPQGQSQQITVPADGVVRARLVAPIPVGRRTPAGRGREHWRTYSVADGIVSNSAYALLQDRNGILWIGTENGLTRYDARSFASFTSREGLAPSTWIVDLAEDSEDNLWIASNTPGKDWGVSRYDGQHFTLFDMPAGEQWQVRALLGDRAGNMWLATAGAGISRWDGQELVTWDEGDGLQSNTINDIWESDAGQLWLATDAGVSRFDGASFTSIGEGVLGRTQAIVGDPSGTMWFGTSDGLWRAADGRLERLPLPEGAGTRIGTLSVDSRGRLWIGTLAGLVCFDGEFVFYDTEDGLAYPAVNAIIEDVEGHLWIATGWYGMGGGVSRFDGDRFISFGRTEGTPGDDFRSVVVDDDGDVWMTVVEPTMSQLQNLVRYDGTAFTIWDAADGLSVDAHLGLDQAGNIWLGRSRYDGTTFGSIVAHAESWRSEAVAQDAAGDLWFAMWDLGVMQYDDSGIRPFTKIKGLGQSMPRDVLWTEADQLWIATWFEGLFRWDRVTDQVDHFGLAEGLTDESIASLYEDRDGRVWIGTWGGGVNWYDGQAFHSLTQKDGLAGNWVVDIMQDRRGRMLFATLGGGISLYDGQVLQTLGRRDGLSGNMVFSLAEDADGHIWVATTKGLTRYAPVLSPPWVSIIGTTADKAYGTLEQVRLPSTQDYVSFAFEGRSFRTEPGQMAYVYRLRGHDERWLTTRQEQVAYTDLPVGDYVFEVQAVDRELNYSAAATVRLEIHPTYGMLAAAGATGLSLLGLAVALTYGVRRRRERDRMRAALVRERHRHIEVQPHEIDSWRREDFVETSASMQHILARITELGSTDDRALIHGEAGTGKELIARAMHACSSRQDRAFIPVRCAGLPHDVDLSLAQRTAVLSTLFGHVQGAFPGADTAQQGLVLQADGGTLFLDEVGLLQLPLQTHLLRILTSGQVRPTGAAQAQSFDVRVLAATSENLELQLEMGTFHRGLYEFLASHAIAVPPLRDRVEDIGPLAQHIAGDLMRQMSLPEAPLSDAVLAHLMSCEFAGNVRELRRVLAQALRAAEGRALRPDDLGQTP